ncbi:MAG: aminopeptidase, partial [Saprospiraceae bacterium]
MTSTLSKYAQLLVHYCLDIQKGDRLYVKSTTLAEPLVREVYRYALRAGAHVETKLAFREEGRIFIKEAGTDQLERVSSFYKEAIENFDAYLHIRAPFNLY